MDAKKLLVVDDEIEMAEVVCAFAETAGYTCRATATGSEFLSAVDDFAPTVVVVDIVLENYNGIDLVRCLADKKHPAGIIVMSGFDPLGTHGAKRIGEIHGHRSISRLQKPFTRKDFLAALKAVE